MSGPPPRASTGREPPSAAYAGALYERHRAAVYAFCLHRLRHHEEACDAVQETFTKAWIALRAGQQIALPQPWLLTIARNVCIDRARALRARPGFSQLADLPDTAIRPPPEELADLPAAVRSLPERQRRVFVLRVVLGWSHQEIAEEVGGSHASVAALVGRSRRAVAKRLSGGRLGALVPVPLLWRWTLRNGASSPMTLAGAANAVALVAVSMATALASPGEPARAVAAVSAAAVREPAAMPATAHRSTSTPRAARSPVTVSAGPDETVSAPTDSGATVVRETAPAPIPPPADTETMSAVAEGHGAADAVEQQADAEAAAPVAVAAALDTPRESADPAVEPAEDVRPSDGAAIASDVISDADVAPEDVDPAPSDPTCDTTSRGNGPPEDPGWQGNGNGQVSHGNGPPADPGWHESGRPCDPGSSGHRSGRGSDRAPAVPATGQA